MAIAIRPTRPLRRLFQAGTASAIMLGGLFGFVVPAFAHANDIIAVTSCASPAGTGYVIAWTVANDWNLNETVSLTSVTGGLASITPGTSTIAASGNGSGGSGTAPFHSVTLTQNLSASASGTLTLALQGTWSDGFTAAESGTASLPTNCGAPVQTLGGHIYLCPGGNSPTITEVTGGTLGASGSQAVSTQGNPLAPTSVLAGTYTMNATPPTGYTLVACSGRVRGVSTESVSVPSGGAGVGVFYVEQTAVVPQTIAGHIYLCPGGTTATTTEVPGGTLGVSGAQTVASQPNPITPTGVAAGTCTMNATPPTGYTLVACSGRVPGVKTESVTVSSGGAGVGVFYVEQTVVVTETLAGHIYLCPGDTAPSTTEATGGTLGATGPQSVPTGSNPMTPTGVVAGSYTMTATARAGYTLVSCNGLEPGVSTESVNVPTGSTGNGVFYVETTVITPAKLSSGTSPATATPVTATPPAATPTDGALAFTGAPLGKMAAAGGVLIGLGFAIILGLSVSHRIRRRHPSS